MSLERRQEYAANLLLEDSRLRGALRDEVFAPLLDWALSWSDAYAAAAAGPGDDWRRPVEVGVAWIKSQLAALVGLLESWPDRSAAARRAALDGLAPTFPAPRLAAESERVAALGDPAEAAAALARALPRGPL